MARTTWTTGIAILFLLAATNARARADDADLEARTTVRIDAKVDVTAAGDAKAVVTLGFHPESFGAVKQKFPDPRKFLQDVRSSRADYETASDMKALYDDASSSVILRMTELGAGRNQGEGVWAMSLPADYELSKSSAADAPRPVATFSNRGVYDNGAKYVGTYEYALPAGATEANFDAEAHLLSWKLEHAGGTGPGRLTASFRAKDRLMSTIYKLYGLGADFGAQWVAKTVLKNAGTNVVKNVRVRYRIERYTDWSPWDKFPEVVPGQTVVSVYYPVIDAAIAKIHSNTPANVFLEWSYEDANGKKHEDDDAKKVVLLGVNEYVFSNLTAGESFGSWDESSNNAPLLAAWVFRNDPVIKEFASMANKNAAGTGASTDDKTALEVLKACYEILRSNDFTYQHPPALDDKTISFDVQRVQNVKFPRDTIRDKSGTCIDLAILYASLVNAVGLEPHLALIPGHCFPVVKLPSGTWVAVETTGVAGGLRFNSAPFERVLEYGNKELKDANADGRIHLVDVHGLWTRGVSNPELDDLPADILQRWGISAEGRGTPQGGPAVGPQPSAQGGGGTQRSGNDLIGLWSGPLSEKQADGSVLRYTWTLGIDQAGEGRYRATGRAEVKVPSPQGEIPVVLVQYFGGSIEDGMLVLVGEKKTLTNTANGASKEMTPPDTVKIQFDGDDIVGKLGTDATGWQDFRMKREGGASAPQPPSTPSAPAADANDPVGAWEGSLSERLQDGRTISYPYVVAIERPGKGAYAATARAEATVTTPSGNQTVVIDWTYGGQVEDGTLVLRSRSKVIANKTLNTSKAATADEVRIRFDGADLVGKVGTDASGWQEFRLKRRAAAAPAADAAALARVWEGVLKTTLPDGTPAEGPFRFGVDVGEGGKLTAGMRYEATVKGQRIALIEYFDGRRNADGSFLFHANKVEIKNLTTGVEQSGTPDSIVCRVESGRLVGKVGNDAEGWNAFSLAPQK